MNSELIVKDVEFHGDMLRAAQDPDGKVWVGVRWVCQGIGFGEDKIDNETKENSERYCTFQGSEILLPWRRSCKIKCFMY